MHYASFNVFNPNVTIRTFCARVFAVANPSVVLSCV